MIRDFIYFDKQKVISYGSQLLGGMTDRVEEIVGVSSNVKNQVDLKGNINGEIGIGTSSANFLSTLISKLGDAKIGIEGSTELNRIKSKSNESTVTTDKLLDHYQFTLLRDSLMEQHYLHDLDIYTTSDWNRDKIRHKIAPGDFIEFTCNARLFDTKHLSNVVKTFEKLIELIQQNVIAEEYGNLKDSNSIKKYVKYIQENDVEYGMNILSKVLGNKINPLMYNALLEFVKGISEGNMSTVDTKYYFTHSRPKNREKLSFCCTS